MTEIMKTQVELALQNRHVPALSQPQVPVAAVVLERSKAEKLQDAMEIESRRRAQQILDDRKRKFNSLDADAKEVTGEFLSLLFFRGFCVQFVTMFFLQRRKWRHIACIISALLIQWLHS